MSHELTMIESFKCLLQMSDAIFLRIRQNQKGSSFETRFITKEHAF